MSPCCVRIELFGLLAFVHSVCAFDFAEQLAAPLQHGGRSRRLRSRMVHAGHVAARPGVPTFRMQSPTHLTSPAAFCQAFDNETSYDNLGVAIVGLSPVTIFAFVVHDWSYFLASFDLRFESRTRHFRAPVLRVCSVRSRSAKASGTSRAAAATLMTTEISSIREPTDASPCVFSRCPFALMPRCSLVVRFSVGPTKCCALS